MFPVVHLGEVQEFLHIITDVFPFFPYHSDLYADGQLNQLLEGEILSFGKEERQIKIGRAHV